MSLESTAIPRIEPSVPAASRIPPTQPSPPEACGWSRARWSLLVGGILTAHVAAIFYFGARPSPPPPPASFPTAVHWAADPSSTHQLTAQPELRNAALFALPSLEGFSGAAWLRYKVPHLEPVQAPEPKVWLEPDVTPLGRQWMEAAMNSTSAPLRVADLPLPSLLGSQPRFVDESFPAGSELIPQGALARRGILNSVPLGSWPSSQLLSNTIAQVLLDPAGEPFSASLIESSGLKAADEAALRAARQLRFEPLSGTNDAWMTGQILFRWHTLPLNQGSNLVSKPSPP